MELLDEDKLAQFIRSIVIEMKPELKSDINKADVKRMIESSSREWLNAITRWKKSDLDAFWKRRGVEGYL